MLTYGEYAFPSVPAWPCVGMHHRRGKIKKKKKEGHIGDGVKCCYFWSFYYKSHFTSFAKQLVYVFVPAYCQYLATIGDDEWRIFCWRLTEMLRESVLHNSSDLTPTDMAVCIKTIAKYCWTCHTKLLCFLWLNGTIFLTGNQIFGGFWSL